jgi:hypothetical protein
VASRFALWSFSADPSVDAGVEKIDIGFDSNELAAKIAKNFQELGT